MLISFGFNVNEDFFSSETKDIATSLKKELKKDFNTKKVEYYNLFVCFKGFNEKRCSSFIFGIF